MFSKNHKSVSVRMALVLVLIAGAFGVMPAYASAETINPTVSNSGFLNDDGTPKLDGSALASFQADSWDVQLDSERGPIFSPKDREAFSPLVATNAGNWSALGSNADGTDGAINHPSFPGIYDIVVSGTDVYVAGCFVNAGGDPTADYVAKWDGTNWSGLGNDGAAIPDGAIKNCQVSTSALAVNGTDVYIGGYPNTWIGGAPAPQAKYLAKWDGTSWSGLGDDGAGGSSINSSWVNAIAINGNDVYVGGNFTNVKNGTTTLTDADYIARWDGTNWFALGNDGMGNGALSGGFVETILVMNSDVYVGGLFIDVFNGLNEIPEATYLAKWDGAQWDAVGSSGDAYYGGSILNVVNGLSTDGANLYAVGAFENVNNNGTILTAADHIARWDGANWFALGSDGSGNGALNGTPITVKSNGTDIYVAGGFTNVNNNGTVLTAADYVAKWNGTDWSALGSNGGGDGALNTYAYTLGLLGDELFVGGEFTDVNNNGTVLNTADYIAAYDTCTSGSITVLNTNDSGTGSLRQAIADICSGGTINFDALLSGQMITLGSTLVIDKNLTIDGSALASKISISGNNEVQVMLVNPGISSTLDTLTIADGYVFGNGGGIYNNDGTLEVVNSTFSNNSAGAGGGIRNNGTLTVTNSTFSNNSARAGGGINNQGTLTVTNTNFSGNSADFGGGIDNNAGTVTITNTNFSGNSATYSTGGGINNYAGTVTITDSAFSGNSAAIGGGIFTNDGILTVANSTFSGNSATHGGNGTGGGIVNTNNTGTGTLIVTNSTFSGNSADYGGGILNYSPSGVPTATVTNSTFSGNSAGFWGGGILNSGVFTLTNSTLSGNSADIGGGIYNDGTLHYVNTLLANSTSGGDCFNEEGTISTNTNNLVEDGSCSAALSGDPLLETLTDNGDPTQTMALLPGSPAINAGDDTICAAAPVNNLDQRGVTRPQGGQCDIGAYEYQPILYVKWDASGANTGTSWSNAYTDLQSALSAASSGDEIWVAAGTYKPTTDADRTISFTLKNGVAIYGGFAGTETLRMQRDPAANVTILSGDLNGDDNNNIAHDEPTRSENVYHVILSFGVDASAILDGFTITGGNANVNSVSAKPRGGGIWNEGSPTLKNLIITNNSSAQAGGGMQAVNSNSTLTDVTFSNNSSYGGGGLFTEQSNPTLIRVTFVNNKASHAGGGVDNHFGSNPTFIDVTFTGNTAGLGGAMSNYQNSNPQISRSTFYNNQADYISTGTGQGGGIYNNASQPLIENTTFSGNIAEYGGSAIANNTSSPTLINVTITNNWDGIRNDASHPVIRNSILWGNYPYPGTVATVSDDANSATTIYDSVIQNGFPGGTNIITTDPLLGVLGNYGGSTQTIPLLSGSSAIDTGSNANCPSTDQRGVTRPQGGQCDIGAYEFMNTPSGALTSWNNTFSWTGVSGATWYLVQVQATDDTVILQKWYTADSVGCSGDLSCIVSPEETLTLANGDYHWRTLDYGDYGYGSWTPYTNFNLNAACYTLATNVLPIESGTINTSSQNCSGGYIAGTVVQLSAVPNSGYAFASWSGNLSGTSNPMLVTMDANKNVTANLMSLGAMLISPSDTLTSWDNAFSWTGVTGASWYLVQVQAADESVVLQKWYTADAAGCSGDLSCAVSPEETLTLANGDYHWRILDYGDYGYGSWTPYTNFNLNAACYTLTTNVLPAGSGTFYATAQNCSGGYIAGTVVQLTTVPNSGYAFASWSGDATGTSNPVLVTMDANKNVTANLLSLGATLIAPAGEQTSWNNSFSWTGINEATWYLVQAQAADDTVILQKWYTADAAGCSGDLSCVVSPEETLNLGNGDYKWRILDYGDYGYGSWTPYTDFNLNAVCYTLTTNVLPSGSGTVTTSEQNCSGGYLSGTMVQLTALSNSGYVFASWSGNAAGTSNPVSIIMDANKNVTANMMGLGATLISPAGALTSWDNTFSWIGVNEATWYLVQVQAADERVILQKWYTADAAGCSGDLSCAVSPAETLTLANSDYKWRILDYGEYGYGSWSPYTTFSLNQ